MRTGTVSVASAFTILVAETESMLPVHILTGQPQYGTLPGRQPLTVGASQSDLLTYESYYIMDAMPNASFPGIL